MNSDISKLTMKVPKQKVEEHMKHFIEECRSAGLKLTHQRLELFRGVVESGDRPEAERVYQRLN